LATTAARDESAAMYMSAGGVTSYIGSESACRDALELVTVSYTGFVNDWFARSAGVCGSSLGFLFLFLLYRMASTMASVHATRVMTM